MVILTLKPMPTFFPIDDSTIIKVQLATTNVITEPQHPRMSAVPILMSLTHNILVHGYFCFLTPPFWCDFLDGLVQHRLLVLSDHVGTHTSHFDFTLHLNIARGRNVWPQARILLPSFPQQLLHKFHRCFPYTLLQCTTHHQSWTSPHHQGTTW